ncbi:MAG: ABC transporter ATP-binding protein [SAR202 cluster bacterium]|nr:ABC transporter ATP-binding protein [SAR202 cluster bacterium]
MTTNVSPNLAADEVISVNGLKIHYPTDEGVVKAVDGVDFKLKPGETLGVVGESGCGKSTVGRAILNILDKPGKIEGGEIAWRLPDDRVIDITKLDANSRMMRSIRGAGIALVFQEPMTSFSPLHTVGNQVAEALRLHTDLSEQGIVDRSIELLQMVGIPNAEQRLKEYAFQLSGGLRQRAMIAMALSCEPRLLIADEPTTALDVTTQAQILDLLRELQQTNDMSVILITHNLGVIAEMADNVCVMYLGKAVESGPVDEIFANPQHPYTQGLLRSIPSIYTRNVERLPSIRGSIPHPFNRPSGCTFRPRCPNYMDGVCDQNTPVFQPLEGTSQMVSCFLHHKPEEQTAPPAEGVA